MSNEYPIKPATHSISVKEQNANIAKEALASVASLNEGQRGTRIVTAGMVRTIVKRSLENTKDQAYSLRRQRALAEVFQFSSAIRQDRPLTASAANADLLPIAHPQSTRSHKLDSKEIFTLHARWYADDPRVTNPLVAPLLASAFTAHPNSPEYEYSVARLSAMGTSEVPIEALVAAFLPGANKFFWMRQLRGRNGRFIKMGGALRRFVRRAGKVFSLGGRMVSANPNSKKVTMELPNGRLVRFPAAEGESAKALLPSKQSSDGFSKDPVNTSASDPVIDEADLEFVDSPDGWSTDNSWEPSQDDKDYYGDKVDLGTMYVDENNNYEVLRFDKANFPAKNRFEMAQQKEAEGNDVVAYGRGKDGELDPNLPVYFIRRKDGKDKDFAAVQSWGEIQQLTAEDEELYEKGQASDPKRPAAIAELKSADLEVGDVADVDALEGDLVPGDPNASKAKVKAYEKKLAKFKEEGGEFPIDPRREHFLMDDGTIIDTETGVVLRDSQGNAEPTAPEGVAEAEPIAELPETSDAPEAASTPTPVPEGYYDVTRSEYFPEGATEGQTSPDYTDDPVGLAQEYSAKDLTTALAQAVRGTKENPATGFGQLPFADGFEVVPAEALYKALDEQGEEADQILDDIYAGGDGTATPKIAPETKASLGEELPEAAQGEKSDQEIPPLIDGLTEDEKSDFLETGDYKKYLPENKIYEDSDVPEGYSGIDNEPWTEIEGDLPEDAPEGFSVNPVDIANDYSNEGLVSELRRALEPGNTTPGYGVLGIDTPEGEEYVANVPAEAIRDALQLQGVDTDELIDAIYQEGFDGQGENEPTPEEIQDALEGEDVEEGQEPTAESEEEEITPAEEPTPSDEAGPPTAPPTPGISTGEPDGPAKLTVKTKDLKPGDISISDYFTIEEILSDEESEAKKPGSFWVVGYYPGHATQKTKLWSAETEIDVFRNITAPPKGDLPELSKPKPKEFDPEGKIFKDKELDVFVPKDAEARSKYLDSLDQYNKDLTTAKAVWTDAPEPGSLPSWQAEDVAAPFTPANPVGVITVKSTDVKPGDVTFKKEKGNDFYEFFIVEGVEEKDGKAIVTGYYPGHVSQTKEWNATTEINVMRGASDLPAPGTGPALARPKKGEPDIQQKYIDFNAAKKLSAEGFTPPLDPEASDPNVSPQPTGTTAVVPPKPKSPAYPAFTGEKLKQIAAEADGDPIKFMELLQNEEVMVLDFETAADGAFDKQTPIQFAYTKFKNGQGIATGTFWMNPEVPLGKFYTEPKNPDEVLRDPTGKVISNEFLETQPPVDEQMAKIFERIGPDTIILAHNVPFDGQILKRYAEKLGVDYAPAGEIDTLALARLVINGDSHTLQNVAKYYGIVPEGSWHDANTDSEVLFPILDKLMADMAKTKQGIQALDVEANTQKYEEDLAVYKASKDKNAIAETSLAVSKPIKDAFDGKEDLPTVDELIESVPKELPSSEEATSATTPAPAQVSDGDEQIVSILGDTVSNNWVNDDENTTDLGPVPVEDWLPGDFYPAKSGGWFEILEITPDPEDDKKVFAKRRLIANGKVYGEEKSWIKFKAYTIRRRNNVVEERAIAAETPTPTAETAESWQGYDIKQDSDGIYFADGISASDVQKLRNGQLTPPQLPFFAPMGGGNKPDQGDGYFFSANGKRFWGKFGAAGALVRRKNNKGEYEYLLAKRSAGLSQGGGKWGYPGGAHKDKMDAEENMGIITAINEFEEEVGGDLGADTAVPNGKFSDPVAPDWTYTTHFFDVGPDEMKGLSPKDGENSEIGWFTAEQINKMAEDGQLQDDFAESATTILENLDDAPDADEAAVPQTGDVAPSALGATFDTSKWKKVSGQAGSNQGAFYVDPATGQQYYVKKPKSETHAANEVLASALYEQAGLDVGRAYLGTDKSGNLVIVSPIIEGTDGTLGQIATNQNIIDEIKKGFAVDAWMNNYDVIGLEKDNIVVANAKPFRIDAGGALLFRAQGVSKAEEMDTNVSEQIASLRDPSQNAQAASVFGDMTDAEIAESAKLVAAIDEAKIDELVDAAFAGDVPGISSQSIADKLKENLKRRRKELIDLYNVEEAPEPEAPSVPEAQDESEESVKLAINPFAEGDEEAQIDSITAQIQKAIKEGRDIVFAYNGKTVKISPEEVKTAGTGNVNVVGTLPNGQYRSFTLLKMEQSDAPTPTPAEAPEAPEAPEQTGIFKEYSPDNSLTGAENTPLSELGFDPEEDITVYRGVPKGIEDINSGDWVTSLEQLAKDYAGADGDVISKTVKAKDLLTDPSSGEGAYTEEMVYSPAAADVDFPEPTGEPVDTEKPTEVPQDQKQKLIAKTEKVAEALFGNKDPEQVKKVLESFKEAEVEDPELVDSILNDLTNPAPAPAPKDTPEEKIADDIVQALTPEDGDEDVPEAELKTIDPEELAKELANPTDPDLIWAKVKEDYEASTLDNGHIVVSSSMFGKVRMDVLVKRNSDNTFSVYHRITDTDTGETRVKEMVGRWHSYTALNSRVQTEIYKSKALPAKVVAGSKKEGAATLQPSLPPKQKEAYVSADGKTVITVGMTVTDTKTGKKGVVTSLKDEYVVKSGGKTYIYTDAAKVKFEGAAKANWKISSFLMPEGSELPSAPDADGEQGEQPGDGGTPPTAPTPTTPAPATPEPVAASEEVVDLPGYEGPSTSGASTISEIETNAVAKNSDEYLSAFGAANYSDYKEFLKGMFVKDGDGGNGKNLVPGVLVQNASPGSGDQDLTSYGVVNLTDADTGNIGVSWLDGPLKGESQVLKSNEVWSREKFISTKQADELGVELDQKLFNTSKEKAIAKGKEYIEKQAKAKELAEKKAAQDKIEKEAKAAKQAKKDQFTVNGPGFSIQTANLPEADWSSSPAENVPSLSSALETVKGDNNLAASNGVTTLIDADKVEDLEVRIQKVTGKGNKEQIRLSLTLTDWAANGAVAEFIDDEAVAKSDGIDLDQWEKTEDGKLVRKKKWSTSYVAYSSGTTYSGKVGKGTFKLHRANKNAEKPDFFKHGNYSDAAVSFHNKAEIFLPANATEADIQKALEDFGAIQNVRPATQQDIKGMVENKMIWLYGSETDGTKNFTGDLRKEQLDFIEKNYGFTADDVEISVDTNGYGRINYLIPAEAAKKIAEDKDVKYFQHNWTGDSLPSGVDAKAAYIYNLFASGGLYATANRWMNGVNSSGMSSKTDVKAAGGNYMFTSPVSGNSNGDNYSLRFTFDGEKLLRRMDWYKNNGDKYGQLGSDEENNISKLGQGGEVMWKKNLSWADLSGIELNSEVRKMLIEMLTADDNTVPDATNLLEVLKAGDK